MNISVSEVEEVTVVMFKGNLDTGTAPEAQAKLDELMATGTTKLLVDCSELDYISSARLGVMLATAKRLGSGAGLRFCSLNETVREVFDASGLSRVFGVSGDRTEALASF